MLMMGYEHNRRHLCPDGCGHAVDSGLCRCAGFAPEMAASNPDWRQHFGAAFDKLARSNCHRCCRVDLSGVTGFGEYQLGAISSFDFPSGPPCVLGDQWLDVGCGFFQIRQSRSIADIAQRHTNIPQ